MSQGSTTGDMADVGQVSAPVVPAHVQLIQMATAYWASRLLYVGAKSPLRYRNIWVREIREHSQSSQLEGGVRSQLTQ